MNERLINVINAPVVEYIDHMGSDARVRNVAWTSFDRWGNEEVFNERGLLDYLATGLPANERGDWENRAKASTHWSPYAHCFLTVRCKAPIFLARQLVKHQVGLSWNEESRRYIKSDVELYVPSVFHKSPENAKQGASKEAHTGYVRKDAKFGGVDLSAHEAVTLAAKQSVEAYYELLEAGVAPEEARMVLPLNSVTNWIWSGSLMAFVRVYKQRVDPHAQNIAQDFARQLGEILKEKWPNSFEALTS